MEIVRQIEDQTLVLALAGKFDATWSGSVDDAVGTAIREGRHHICLDLTNVDYISSAGLRVLISHFKQLKAIQGAFWIRNAQPGVLKVIELSGLGAMLVAGASLTPAAPETVREFSTANARWEMHGTASQTSLQEVLNEGVQISSTRFGLGIGAPSADANEAASRLGECVFAAGCLAHLPPGGNRADFSVSEGNWTPSAWLFSGLAVDASPALLLRYESANRIGLAEIASATVEAAGGPCAFVMVAECSGLVGASLRQPPVNDDLFSFPSVRERIDFTTERAFRDSVALVVGVAAPPGSPWSASLRPSGGGPDLHAHAAVFPYRPVRKGRIDLAETVRGLFDLGGLQSVLHLLNDTREPDGTGESEFFRGACWVSSLEPGINNPESRIG